MSHSPLNATAGGCFVYGLGAADHHRRICKLFERPEKFLSCVEPQTENGTLGNHRHL